MKRDDLREKHHDPHEVPKDSFDFYARYPELLEDGSWGHNGEGSKWDSRALGPRPPQDLVFEGFGFGPLQKGTRDRPVEASIDDMADYQLARWAQSVLQQAHEKPFFLAAGFYRPHLPWIVPGRFFDLYPLDEIRLPDVRMTDRRIRGVRDVLNTLIPDDGVPMTRRPVKKSIR